MTPKAKYYETLANTMIKNFEKRRMEAYYCPTAKEAVETGLSVRRRKIPEKYSTTH